MRLSKRGKRRLALVAAVALVGVIGAVTFKTVRRVQQTRLYTAARVDGLAAHEKDDLDTAIDRLSYYLQSGASGDVEVLMAFGDARAQVPMTNRQHVTDAIGLYSTALDVLDKEADQPDRAERRRETLIRLVDLHGSAGLYFEQIEFADRLLELDPGNVEAIAARATARVVRRTEGDDGAERDLDLALADARRLVALEPDNVAWRQLELEIMRRDDRPFRDMIERVDQWLAEDGDADGRYHVLRAGLLAASRRYEEARGAMRDALEHETDAIEVVELKIGMLDELRMDEEADTLIAYAREQFSAQWALLLGVRRLLEEDQNEAALAAIQAAREDMGALEPELLKLEARILLESGRRGELAAVLEELRKVETPSEKEQDALHAWARAVHAWSNLEEQGWTEVLTRLDQAIILQADDPTLHLLKGETLSLIGERTRASESFREALDRDAGWVHAVVRYTQSLIDIDRPDEAFAILCKWYILPVVNGDSSRRLIRPFLVGAQAFVAMQRSDSNLLVEKSAREMGEMLTAFAEAVQKEAPGNPDVAVILVELYEQVDQTAEAQRFLETAAASQDSVDVLLALADATRRIDLGEQWSLAERAPLERALVERAEALGGRTATVMVALANLAADEGRPREALDTIEEALARPGLTDAETLRAARARLSFMDRLDHPDLVEELRSFQSAFERFPEAQAYVLSLSAAIQDPEVVRSAVDGLAASLGDDAHQVRLARAWLHLRLGDGDEAELAKAIKLLQALVKDAPDSVTAQLLLADALFVVDPASRVGTQHLRKAIDLAPGQAELYPKLITLLQRQGDTEGASAYLERLATLDVVDAKTRRVEPRLLAKQGDFETALARASNLADELSDENERLWLAALSRRAGDFEKAEAIYTALLADQPSATAAFDAATFLADQGRYETGVELLEQLSDPDVNRALLLGQFHERCGNPDLAGRWLQEAVRTDADSPEARRALARFLLGQGGRANVAEALTHAERGLQLAPQDQTLRSTVAMAQIAGGGDSTLATRELRELVGDNEDLLAMLSFIQGLRDGDGRASSRDSTLEEARRLTVEHGRVPQVWMLASRLHGRAGEFDDAIELARAAVDRFPASPGPAELATQLLIADGRWGEAVIEAGRWRRRSLGNPLPVDETIAYLYLQLDQPGNAVAQLQPHAARIAAEADRRPQRYEIWLQALIADGRRAAALSSISERLSQAMWRSRWIRVAMMLDDESAEWAMSQLPEAAIVDPGEQLALAGAWHGLAMRSGRVEHDQTAEAWATKAMRGRSVRLEATVVRGAIAEGRGEMDRAETLYREVLEQAPDHAVALNNLAFLLASTGRPDEAVTLAERSVELLPPESGGSKPADDDLFRRATVLDTYANALLAAGRIDEAENVVKKALKLSPRDPTIMLTLAQTLIDAGELTRAEEQLNLAKARLGHIRRPERQQIVRAERLQKQLETKLSDESRGESASRFSEASTVDAGGS